MGCCSLIRYLGLIFLLAVFVASGFSCVSNPSASAMMLAKSNLPQLLRMAGVKYRLNAAEYTMIVQGLGASFIGFSLLILLGVGRSFFAFLLALIVALLTVVFRIDLKNPAKMSEADAFNVLRDAAIFGGLLIVAGGMCRSRPVHRANEATREKKRN
uniref:WGS project CAEQ00000000 data, annotated contig 322 n=1 Tax=Trypanosoma congolense (strain IL3000) TaxID=1068625 RepID=F9WEW9_TRYCI|nr:unnamed protein product [Trypanosoma congolense IL3000]